VILIVIVNVRLLLNSVVVRGWVGVSVLAVSRRRIEIQLSREYCSEHALTEKKGWITVPALMRGRRCTYIAVNEAPESMRWPHTYIHMSIDARHTCLAVRPPAEVLVAGLKLEQSYLL
jgi:hypothetical protein